MLGYHHYVLGHPQPLLRYENGSFEKSIYKPLSEGRIPFNYPKANLYAPETLDDLAWQLLLVTNFIFYVAALYYTYRFVDYYRGEQEKAQK